MFLSEFKESPANSIGPLLDKMKTPKDGLSLLARTIAYLLLHTTFVVIYVARPTTLAGTEVQKRKINNSS